MNYPSPRAPDLLASYQMRPFILLLAALSLPLSAEKVAFDKDERFSLEFSDKWVKAKTSKNEALVYREHKDGDASFTVTRLAIPAERRADLPATLKTLVNTFKKAGMTIVGDVKGQEGQVDGKRSLFAVAPAKIKSGETLHDLSFFLVLIEASDRIIILQGALPGKSSNELRRDCLNIINSFREKSPDTGEKKEVKKSE